MVTTQDETIARLQRANVEQRQALDAALAREAALSEVLQVINASPGNLKPIFDAMLEKAMRLCGAAFGELYTFDGENFTRGAHQGYPPPSQNSA